MTKGSCNTHTRRRTSIYWAGICFQKVKQTFYGKTYFNYFQVITNQTPTQKSFLVFAKSEKHLWSSILIFFLHKLQNFFYWCLVEESSETTSSTQYQTSNTYYYYFLVEKGRGVGPLSTKYQSWNKGSSHIDFYSATSAKAYLHETRVQVNSRPHLSSLP